MSLLYAFKQSVLDLGRGEAKTKAKPLLIGDEHIDRSASGLDRRASERSVMFWLLSDRALFLVVGSDPDDDAFRIPYEEISEMSLDFDETATFLPWYIRMTLSSEGPGRITRLVAGNRPGQPLSEAPPEAIDDETRRVLARGEIVPLSGFAACPERFRGALSRRMELAGVPLNIAGGEAADARQWSPKAKRRSSPH
jgi:hypothetical protein